MKRCRLSTLFSSLLLYGLLGTVTAHADPRGLWQAEDGAHIRIGLCGQALCATVATPKSPVDPETGAPWTDKHNPDAQMRSRPLVGVAVLYSMTQDAPNRWSGALYNVDNGQTYQGHLVELDRNTVRVEGCVIGICGGRNMHRLQ
jgi:uncharacterized protein (DUF2147 family)